MWLLRCVLATVGIASPHMRASRAFTPRGVLQPLDLSPFSGSSKQFGGNALNIDGRLIVGNIRHHDMRCTGIEERTLLKLTVRDLTSDAGRQVIRDTVHDRPIQNALKVRQDSNHAPPMSPLQCNQFVAGWTSTPPSASWRKCSATPAASENSAGVSDKRWIWSGLMISSRPG